MAAICRSVSFRLLMSGASLNSSARWFVTVSQTTPRVARRFLLQAVLSIGGASGEHRSVSIQAELKCRTRTEDRYLWVTDSQDRTKYSKLQYWLQFGTLLDHADRKSTRLNSSHL